MFQTKRIYRGLNGGELKQILPQRVAEAMSTDNAVNVTRGFPLLKYEVKITLAPYRAAGTTREGLPVDLPDTAIVYEVEGEGADGKLIGQFRSSGLRPAFAPKAAYFGLEKALYETMA